MSAKLTLEINGEVFTFSSPRYSKNIERFLLEGEPLNGLYPDQELGMMMSADLFWPAYRKYLKSIGVKCHPSFEFEYLAEDFVKCDCGGELTTGTHSNWCTKG